MQELRRQHELAVCLVECGFFFRSDQAPHEYEQNGFLFVPMAGVEQVTQFRRVHVGEHAREFVVVDSKGSADRGVARAAADSRFSAAGCVLLLEDGEGYATIEHVLEAESMEIAAAVAVIRYSAAWDESAVIVVTDSSSQHDVSITLEEGCLWALVTTKPTTERP